MPNNKEILNQMLNNFKAQDEAAVKELNMLAGAFGGNAPIERTIQFLNKRSEQTLAIIGKIAEIVLEVEQKAPDNNTKPTRKRHNPKKGHK